jgi:hypothetical protein
MQGNLTRQDSRTCTPLPLFVSSTYASVSWIESSGDVRSFLIISVAGEFPRHDLALYSASDYLQNLVVDRMTMVSDLSSTYM